MIPLNTRIGIKNPYKKVTILNTFSLRNDNPQNIIIINTNDYGLSPIKLKEAGNALFKDKQFGLAIMKFK